MTTARNDSGSASVLAAAMVAVLLCVTCGGIYLGAVVVARHRAQAAADLAAVAAAMALPAGAAPACEHAAGVARKMRADDIGCQVHDLDVSVTVEVAVLAPWGAGRARAAARAGPGPVSKTPGHGTH